MQVTGVRIMIIVVQSYKNYLKMLVFYKQVPHGIQVVCKSCFKRPRRSPMSPGLLHDRPIRQEKHKESPKMAGQSIQVKLCGCWFHNDDFRCKEN